MALPATSGIQPLGLAQFVIFPFSAGSPGTGVAATVNGLTSEAQTTEVEHRGNDKVIAKIQTFDSLDWTVTLSEWKQPIIAGIVGGTISTSGTTPNQISILKHKSTDNPPPFAFKAQAQSRGADGGATLLTSPYNNPGSLPPYGFTDQEFQDLDIDFSGIPNGSDEVVYMTLLESNAAISMTWA